MKSITPCKAILMAAGLAQVAMAPKAQDGLVSWDVDPSQSYVRLAIPDTTLDLNGTAVTVRLRDANSNAWSDAGGRRAFLDGTIETDLNDGSSVEFLSGTHNLFALEQTLLRPNPAQFDPGAVNADNPDGQYTGTGTALAAYGAKVRGTALSIITFDAAYLAFRDVLFDIASGVVPLTGGTTIAGSATNVGIASANIDADGLALPLGLGQPIPDLINQNVSLGTLTNVAGGTVTNLGGDFRKLLLTVNVPISLDVEGIIVNGTATGQIVAFATVPEPSTVLMATMAMLGLCWTGRRRLVRR